jgi:hypothetical protein
MVAGMERVFTHAEATALLPRLTDLLTALRTAQRAAAEQGGEPGRHTMSTNGSAAAAVTASGPLLDVQRLAGDLESLGVILRDPESGLVDFASVRDDEQIYLCWRLGEERIEFWHPRDTGFMGRQPL